MTKNTNPMSRRAALARLGAAAGAVIMALALSAGWTTPAQAHGLGEYHESPLPYDWSSLEGFLSAKTLQDLYENHQRAHVRAANQLIKELAKDRSNPESLGQSPDLYRQLAFHASGHALYNVFFRSVNPHSSAEPTGDVLAHVTENFQSAGKFKDLLRDAAKQHEGDGWIVVAWDPMTSRLNIFSVDESYAMPLQGATPLLAMNLNKTAYEPDYGHRRDDYVEKFLDRLDWDYLGLQLVRHH